MLNLLTATGARPEAFDLCKRWMEAQDYTKPVRWVVVDDGPEPIETSFSRENWEIVRVRPEPLWSPGKNTQARNLLYGLHEVTGPLAIIEDDDYYAPDWLTTVVEQLEVAELVGESGAVYYNVKTRTSKRMDHPRRASLCATALRGSAIDRLREVCKSHRKNIDIHLWRHPSRHTFHGNRVIGMKGLPGRENIGIGKSLSGKPDTNLTILRGLIGKDADHYARF